MNYHTTFLQLHSKTKYTDTILFCVVAFRLEWYSHCVLLWYCHVSLHLAQRNRELKNHYQVWKPPLNSKTLCSVPLNAYFLLRFTWHRHAFATLSFLAETFIFLYVGMDALDIDKWRSVSDSPGTSVAVSSILIGLLMLGRAAFVFPLSFLSNLAKKNQSEKIDFKMQVWIIPTWY